MLTCGRGPPACWRGSPAPPPAAPHAGHAQPYNIQHRRTAMSQREGVRRIVPCLGWRPKHTDAGECWGGCGSGLGRKGGGGDTQHGYLPPFSLAFSRSVCFISGWRHTTIRVFQSGRSFQDVSGCFRTAVNSRDCPPAAKARKPAAPACAGAAPAPRRPARSGAAARRTCRLARGEACH